MIALGDSRVPERIWRKVVAGDDGCWLWTGATGGGATHRYGVAQLDGKLRLVHRWMLALVIGGVSDAEHAHHECGVTLCVNPAHLRALPVAEHIGQWHRDKTECPHGHPYSAENTRRRPCGARACRACDRERARRNREVRSAG